MSFGFTIVDWFSLMAIILSNQKYDAGHSCNHLHSFSVLPYSNFLKTLDFVSTISWIGWRFHHSGGFVELPANKIDKIHRYLQQLSKSSRTTRKDLEKFIGILMWVTQLFHTCAFGFIIPATHFSIDRDNLGFSHAWPYD